MDLTDLLKGALGGGQPAARAGGGSSDLIAKLLPLVLQMLQGRQSRTANAAPGGLGGPGSSGGLGDLMSAFTQNGLGDVIGSWIGRGENLPVSGSQLAGVLGEDEIRHLAGRTGASHAEVTDALSQLFPQVVDRLTPDGRIPDEGVDAGAGDILKQLGLSPG